MFSDIDFMKLQKKLRAEPEYSVDIYVCSNAFSSTLRKSTINADREYVQLEEPRILSSAQLAEWIEST